jgi:hypothetical protein
VKANLPKEQSAENLRGDRKFLRSNGRVLRRVRALYPVKTAIYLHQITGEPVRTCEYWLSKDRLPSEAVWALLHSEHGMDFLIDAMGDARPKWWTWLARIFVVTDAICQRDAAEARLKSTVGTARETTDAISRARQAAQIVHDQEPYSPRPDAVHAMASISDSALASAEKD